MVINICGADTKIYNVKNNYGIKHYIDANNQVAKRKYLVKNFYTYPVDLYNKYKKSNPQKARNILYKTMRKPLAFGKYVFSNQQCKNLKSGRTICICLPDNHKLHIKLGFSSFNFAPRNRVCWYGTKIATLKERK